ncbi:hypothetical protein F383_30470 [Gossypium arboreum]|uniref:Uncharacterized protein n=1 Tax=Gossypium arboreum TaxID=29729 RepID=A0A0B0MSA8_GOSAR|nr:hypothetical protein F383_30470 [Gossypium arboreum]
MGLVQGERSVAVFMRLSRSLNGASFVALVDKAKIAEEDCSLRSDQVKALTLTSIPGLVQPPMATQHTPRNKFRRYFEENERFRNNRNTIPERVPDPSSLRVFVAIRDLAWTGKSFHVCWLNANYLSSRTHKDWKTIGESTHYQLVQL